MASVSPLSPATGFHPVSAPRDAAAEANHRVANSLAMVAGLIQIHARGIAAEPGAMQRADVCVLLEEIGHRIDAIGRLHRLLANLVSGSEIELPIYLRDISDAVLSSVSFVGRAQLIHASDGDCLIAAERALPLGLIVTEMVTNAVKYAHPAGILGIITVSCRRTGGRIRVQIADDGIGLPEGFDPAHANSLGMRLARSLAQQLGATLSFKDTGIGLTVEISLPI